MICPPEKINLFKMFQLLLEHFGPQHWWPGKTPFEIMMGAILTQNTNWTNVEKAIANLKRNGVFSPRGLAQLREEELAAMIRPSGYYNQKSLKIKAFLEFFAQYHYDVLRLVNQPVPELRRQLLAIRGIGPETADSILLYALEKPIFVIDAYTRRILSRHGQCAADEGYASLQNLFMSQLKKDAGLYNEFHALLVRVGKEYCRKRRPRCTACPLRHWAALSLDID